MYVNTDLISVLYTESKTARARVINTHECQILWEEGMSKSALWYRNGDIALFR